MGYENIQSKIDFPFGISMSARSALIVFPFLFLALVIFAKIHLSTLRGNLAFSKDSRDVCYPTSFLAPSLGALLSSCLALVLAAVLPLVALFYNPAIDIDDGNTKLICAATYSIAVVATVIYIADIFKTRKRIKGLLKNGTASS